VSTTEVEIDEASSDRTAAALNRLDTSSSEKYMGLLTLIKAIKIKTPFIFIVG
jgi:hypothetical protein|tara:strand:- start:2087 stop:2245 length:159 start_codon:yes stop_codon:yes gene_type:complete